MATSCRRPRNLHSIIAEELQLQLTDLVLVGDSDIDYSAAEKAGIPYYHVAGGIKYDIAGESAAQFTLQRDTACTIAPGDPVAGPLLLCGCRGISALRHRQLGVERRAGQRGSCSCQRQVVGDLTRLLRGDPEVFGEPVAGTLNEPGVTATSVHHIMKQVAGVPNLRPPWFFDITQQGESLADVGTHLVDRIHSTLFLEDSIDYRTEIRLHAATRWPTRVSAGQFRQLTGEPGWPEYLEPWIRGASLDYFCNTRVQYQIRGVHASVETRWDWEAEAGDDTQTACYRGSRAQLELRQGAEDRYRSELYVVPFADIAAALEHRISALQTAYPGVSLAKLGREWRVTIPDALRIGHEAHFAQMTRNFLDHVEHRRPLPAREKPNTLAKYFVCTEGVGISQR
jgi:hypothetical protein